MLAAFPQAVIIRPSILFGQGDGFFNMMGGLARMLPVAAADFGARPASSRPMSAMSPRPWRMAAEGKVKTGRIYELGGPEIETHKDAAGSASCAKPAATRPLVPLPPGFARLLALPLAILPFPPLLTADQVELLGTDNVVSDAAMRDKRTLAAFGITPTAMDTILPTYMWRFRKHGQFDRAEASPTA